MSNPLESWTEEQRSALLYRACADAETDCARAELFRRLAGEAEAQAAIWRAQLTARGHPAPTPYVPDARTQLAEVVREGHPAAFADGVAWLSPEQVQGSQDGQGRSGQSVVSRERSASTDPVGALSPDASI